ncbi:MAG TPA: NlpC/P60 family protein, partial [Bacillota bacterium]|nr:NlpC/P60 family protein [Bacillota bacterium]
MELPANFMLTDLIGKPFLDGGRGPDEFDCWGLASAFFKRMNIKLPDYRIPALESEKIFHQYQTVKNNYIQITNREDSIPCLVFMRLNSAVGNHVGVYLGNGKFIHARASAGVCIERLDHPVYR